jgi:hypothetical protein
MPLQKLVWQPDDEWLEAIEATANSLLGVYTEAEDEAMNTAFGARGKKRLNIVFDIIGFVYPDYCFLVRKQGTKKRIAPTTASTVPKPKNEGCNSSAEALFFGEDCCTACFRKDGGC